MTDNTPIEWTDATWNPVKGCTRLKEGCRNCYAEIMTARFSKPGQWGDGLAKIVRTPDGKADHRWTGQVRFDEAMLTQPLRWRKPRRIFVCSTGDLFHEKVPDDWIDAVFAVMALCPQHTFQVLTKRPERMAEYFNDLARKPSRKFDILLAARRMGLTLDDTKPLDNALAAIPLPNVWLGTSAEDQETADERIPHLLNTPAAVRFLSAEPLLGPIDLTFLKQPNEGGGEWWLDALNKRRGGWFSDEASTTPIDDEMARDDYPTRLDWVITGGESGPGARPMHPDWPRALRDQCIAAGVPFFFKQWGEWQPYSEHDEFAGPALYDIPPMWNPDASTRGRFDAICMDSDGTEYDLGKKGEFPKAPKGAFAGLKSMSMYRVGKKRAGRLLDGREWNQMPGCPNDPQ